MRHAGSVRVCPEKMNADFLGKVNRQREGRRNNHLSEITGKLNYEESLRFAFVFSAVNFCFWAEPRWSYLTPSGFKNGTSGVISALLDAVSRKKLLLSEASNLKDLSFDAFQSIFSGNGELCLMEERHQNLTAVFRHLFIHHSSCEEYIARLGGNAHTVLQSVILLPGHYEDVSVYKGVSVPFYKRAQALTSDLNFLAQAYGRPAFLHSDVLTVCADYKIPQILQANGILEYAPELLQAIAEKRMIPPHSEVEVEIRSATIVACETISDLSGASGSLDVGNALWGLSQETMFDLPYHRTFSQNY